ncbi:MAG: hypothetical protein II972_00435 [Elusimicrobiaceae bacterium]|nr:hypothetical protein [Elusimicrobiaceae bacterium]
MEQTKEETLSILLPKATPAAIKWLALTRQNINNIKEEIASLKIKLSLSESFEADNILADILLGLTSLEAAKRKIEVLKSRQALGEICQILFLDEEYAKLLLKTYATPLSKTLFIQACDELNPDFELKKDSSALSDIIDTLLDKAKKQEEAFLATLEQEKIFLETLLKEKLINKASYLDLSDLFFNQNSLSLKQEWEKLFKELKTIYDNKTLNAELCLNTLKGNITPKEAKEITKLGKVLNKPLLATDLQRLYLKYAPIKSAEEILTTLQTLLKKFDYVYLPEENLSLAVKVMLEASEQNLINAENTASYNKGKILFLRALCSNKFFASFARELTLRFYGKISVQDLSLLLQNITARLPGGTCKENADIGLKVLLGKLTFKEASAQANFLFDKRKKMFSNNFEQEALNTYLGTKSKEEVLNFFHTTLSQYDFWQKDNSKYCFALTILISQLNGNISEEWEITALKLLQEGAPEASVEIILKELSNQIISSFEILNSYRDFYTQTSNHKEAALRVVNKFN